MPVSRNVLSALVAAAAVSKVRAADGPAFSTGPTSSDTYIIESWATLTLPEAPSDNNGDLSLWVGMGTSNGDLIQSIAENYATSDWSVYAYTLMETSSTSQTPIQASGGNADAGVDITFHYKYDSSTGNYTQTVYKAGTVVSTLSTSDGEAEGWGSAVECAEENCGTVPSHTWSNVSITLSAADSSYSDTLALGTDVDATMSTSDGGITWEVGTISIPCWDFSTEAICDSSSSTSTSSSASASASSVSSYTGSSGASPSGTSSSGSSSYGSGSYGSSGAQSSGTPTTGSSGSQSSGSFGSGSGSEDGSSTWGSSGASPSGSFGSGSDSSSSTWASSGASPSGSFGSGSEDGSPTWGSSGASPSGSFGSGSDGASSTWGSSGPQSSDASFGGSSDNESPSWSRSRIYRIGGNKH